MSASETDGYDFNTPVCRQHIYWNGAICPREIFPFTILTEKCYGTKPLRNRRGARYLFRLVANKPYVVNSFGISDSSLMFCSIIALRVEHLQILFSHYFNDIYLTISL